MEDSYLNLCARPLRIFQWLVGWSSRGQTRKRTRPTFHAAQFKKDSKSQGGLYWHGRSQRPRSCQVQNWGVKALEEIFRTTDYLGLSVSDETRWPASGRLPQSGRHQIPTTLYLEPCGDGGVRRDDIKPTRLALRSDSLQIVIQRCQHLVRQLEAYLRLRRQQQPTCLPREGRDWKRQSLRAYLRWIFGENHHLQRRWSIVSHPLLAWHSYQAIQCPWVELDRFIERKPKLKISEIFRMTRLISFKNSLHATKLIIRTWTVIWLICMDYLPQTLQGAIFVMRKMTIKARYAKMDLMVFEIPSGPDAPFDIVSLVTEYFWSLVSHQSTWNSIDWVKNEMIALNSVAYKFVSYF